MIYMKAGCIAIVLPDSYHGFFFCLRMQGLEEAVQNFEDTCKKLALTRWSTLSEKSQYKKVRGNILSRLARALAGGDDPKEIYRQAAGPENITAHRVIGRIEEIKWSCESPTKPDKSSYETMVNLVSCLSPDASYDKVKKLGSTIGETLYTTASTHSNSQDALFQMKPPGGNVGRKKGESAKRVPDAWENLARDSGRVTVSGESIKVYSGGRSKAVKAVMMETGCSRTTAYRDKPSHIVRATKMTDLCPQCEELRIIRLSLISHASSLGYCDFVGIPEDAGQRACKAPGDLAASYLRNLGNTPPHVCDILDQYNILKWHEDIATDASIHNDAMRESTVVLNFDFGSSVALRSGRGDSREFFNPGMVGRFGLSVSTPGNPKSSLDYVDVYYFGLKHTANVAAICLERAVEAAAQAGLINKSAEKLVFFCDRGKHFACAEMVYAVIAQTAPWCREVELFFHPSYHGKTPLDAHFRLTKDRIDEHPLEKWPADVGKIREEVGKAVSGIPSTNTIFLPYPHQPVRVREAIVIKNVTLVRSISLIRDTDYEWRVTQDGQQVGLNLRQLGAPSDQKSALTTASSHEDDETIKRAAICKLITNQKTYLQDRGALVGCVPDPSKVR